MGRVTEMAEKPRSKIWMIAAVVLLFIGRRKRVLERFDERLLTDPLFFHQIGKRRKKLLVYHCIYLLE